MNAGNARPAIARAASLQRTWAIGGARRGRNGECSAGRAVGADDVARGVDTRDANNSGTGTSSTQNAAEAIGAIAIATTTTKQTIAKNGRLRRAHIRMDLPTLRRGDRRTQRLGVQMFSDENAQTEYVAAIEVRFRFTW